MEHAIVEFVTFLGGIIVCVVHRRVSKWMWLVIGSLAGAMLLTIWRIYLFSDIDHYNSYNHGYPLYFSRMYYAFWWALFFTGLSKSLSDKAHRIDEQQVKERIAEFERLAEDDKGCGHQISSEEQSRGNAIQASPGVKAD